MAHADVISGGYHAKRADCEGHSETLAKLIVRHLPDVLCISVSHEDFDTHIPAIAKSQIGGPYRWMLKLLMINIGKLCHQYNARVDYIIERGAPNWEAAQADLDGVAEQTSLMRMFGARTIAWAGKEDWRLHPSDLVSHTCTSSYEGRYSAAGAILASRAHHFHWDADRIRQRAAEIDEIARQEKWHARRAKQAYREYVENGRPFITWDEFLERNFPLPDDLWAD